MILRDRQSSWQVRMQNGSLGCYWLSTAGSLHSELTVGDTRSEEAVNGHLLKQKLFTELRRWAKTMIENFPEVPPILVW